MHDQANHHVVRPDAILPDGVDFTDVTNPYTGLSAQARKGIVAATLGNIVLLNQKLSFGGHETQAGEIESILEEVRGLMPSLAAVGLFDLFTPEEWFNTHEQPGRVLVALLFLQTYPERLTPDLRKRLADLRRDCSYTFINKEIEKVII